MPLRAALLVVREPLQAQGGNPLSKKHPGNDGYRGAFYLFGLNRDGFSRLLQEQCALISGELVGPHVGLQGIG